MIIKKYILITACFSLCILSYLFSLNYSLVVVNGESMEPLAYDGDILLSVNKFEPKFGNIYYIKEPDKDVFALKRLVGMPSDTIFIIDGNYYRNGLLYFIQEFKPYDNFSIDLGEDEYLFIGDNTDKSYDGRYWSRCLKSSDIVCEARIIIYPFYRFKIF